MALKSIPLAEFDNRYGMEKRIPPPPSPRVLARAAARKYHAKIMEMVHGGYNVADIHKAIVALGYGKTYSTLHDYITRYVDTKPAKYHNNQYTLSNRCAKGHEWVDFRWEHSYSTGKDYRRCKICERERLKNE